jgi:hypothetical protein
MNEEARLILSAYRQNHPDSADPAFAKALAATAGDPALAEWLAGEQAFDQQMSAKLREVPIPAGLRERIIAGAKVSRPRRWWRLPQAWMAAALIAILAAAGFFVRTPEKYEIAEWQTHALSVLEQLENGKTGFDHSSRDPGQLVAWLRGQSAPAPAEIPAKLSTQPTYGCKTWQWNGHRISMVCFKAGQKGGIHLFTTPRATLAKAPPEAKPSFGRHGQWFVASWSKDDHAYMLAGEEGETMLRELIARHGASPQVAAAFLPIR